MVSYRIRAFEDRDYPAIVAVGNAVFTDYPWSEEEARHEDSRFAGDKYVLRRFVAEDPDGNVVADAAYHHVPYMFHPRKFWLELIVHPAVQRRGLGSQLYEHLMRDMALHQPLVLWTNVRETFPDSMRFAERRGFAETRRAWESRLDVAGFDPTPFEAKAAAATRRLTVTTVAAERERDLRWLQKLYDMHLEVVADVPAPEPYTPVSLEEYTNRFMDNPGYLPDGHFLASDGERYIAQSNLFRSAPLPEVLYQGITGTRRAYRGRGVALALKLRTVAYARAHGIREIRTWNDTLNAPMLAINTKLGFVRQPAWITYEKHRETSEGGAA